MPWYFYVCPHCECSFDEEWPAGKAPPESDCLHCCRRAKRRFVVPAVIFRGDGFSCSGRFDRPDERLQEEIAHSQDFDATTGKTWEQTDRELERLQKEGVIEKRRPGTPYGVVG